LKFARGSCGFDVSSRLFLEVVATSDDVCMFIVVGFDVVDELGMLERIVEVLKLEGWTASVDPVEVAVNNKLLFPRISSEVA
jgi:hypothetical protein